VGAPHANSLTSPFASRQAVRGAGPLGWRPARKRAGRPERLLPAPSARQLVWSLPARRQTPDSNSLASQKVRAARYALTRSRSRAAAPATAFQAPPLHASPHRAPPGATDPCAPRDKSTSRASKWGQITIQDDPASGARDAERNRALTPLALQPEKAAGMRPCHFLPHPPPRLRGVELHRRAAVVSPERKEHPRRGRDTFASASARSERAAARPRRRGGGWGRGEVRREKCSAPSHAARRDGKGRRKHYTPPP
jgi:hypothetical protein